MRAADRFSVYRGAVRYGVAEWGGGGWVWGVWVGGDCFNDDETLWAVSSKLV